MTEVFPLNSHDQAHIQALLKRKRYICETSDIFIRNVFP